MVAALSIYLVDNLADSDRISSGKLWELLESRVHSSMYGLRLVDETMLVATTPGPPFIFDQLLACPA